MLSIMFKSPVVSCYHGYATTYPVSCKATPDNQWVNNINVFKNIVIIFQSSKKPDAFTQLPMVLNDKVLAEKYHLIPVRKVQKSDMDFLIKNFELFKKIINIHEFSFISINTDHWISTYVKPEILALPTSAKEIPDRNNRENQLEEVHEPDIKGHEMITMVHHQFDDYLKQYHDELPELGKNFKETGTKNANLNCHCHAVKLDDGYDGPADLLKTNMDKQQVIDAIASWYEQKGYHYVEIDAHHQPFKREVRKEKVVVFGITPSEARNLLARCAAISEDLKSTLATVMQFSNPQIIYPTHSIRQNIQGNWESKMGTGPVIEIPDPNVLRGGVYGSPCFLFEKQRIF